VDSSNENDDPRNEELGQLMVNSKAGNKAPEPTVLTFTRKAMKFKGLLADIHSQGNEIQRAAVLCSPK
jgi:hypothetical protein